MMNRIESNLAAAVADQHRPVQAETERRAQVQQVAATEVSDSSKTAGKTIASDEVRAAMAQVQQVVEIAGSRSLEFRLADDRQALLVEIRDRQTDEVIKQIPAEGLLELRDRLDDLVGSLVDEIV